MKTAKSTTRRAAPNGDVEQLAPGSVHYSKSDPRWSRTVDQIIRATEHQRITWLVEPVIAIGEVTAIGGKAKAGKTTFVYKTLEQMGVGGEILKLKVEKAHALIWSERSETINGERFRALFGGRPQPHIHLVTRFDDEFFDRDTGRAFDFEQSLQIVMVEAKRQNCAVVVLDTFSSLARVKDENDAATMQAGLSIVTKAASDYGVAVVLIHHLGRAGWFRGSTVFEAEPSTLLRISGEGTQPRTMELQSNIVSKAPEKVVFNLDDRGDQYVIVQSWDTEAAKDVLAVLSHKKAEAKMASEVSELLGDEDAVAKQTTRRTLETLAKAGKAAYGEEKQSFGHMRKTYWRVGDVRIRKGTER
ncbi:MAG: AAA family ATPase [Candidatus Dormiibacterota bacterium]